MAHLLCAVEGELNFSNAAAVDATIENASLWTRLCFPSLAYFEKKHVRRRRRGRCSVRDLLSVGGVRARLVELLRTAQRARLIGHHLCTLLPVHSAACTTTTATATTAGPNPEGSHQPPWVLGQVQPEVAVDRVPASQPLALPHAQGADRERDLGVDLCLRGLGPDHSRSPTTWLTRRGFSKEANALC